MVGRFSLLIVLLLLLAGASTENAYADSAHSACPLALVKLGGCPTVTGTTDGTTATLTGTHTSDPTPTEPRNSDDADGRTVRIPAPAVPPAPDPNDPCVVRECFTVNDDVDDGGSPITIADIAAFHPVTGAEGMEPNGWIITGLETNFYSSATQHVLTGSILGEPASVRFTPYAWHWDYGDGSRRTSVNGGAPWEALGADEFSATATSHRYVHAGAVTITLTIEFRAEYRFDGADWLPIDGHVAGAPPPVAATAGTAATVLVSDECTADRSGPGC